MRQQSRQPAYIFPSVRSSAPWNLCTLEASRQRLVEEIPPTPAKGLPAWAATGLSPIVNYSAAIPLKPTAAVNPGISSTSDSVPLGWMAKTPTVPTIALSE